MQNPRCEGMCSQVLFLQQGVDSVVNMWTNSLDDPMDWITYICTRAIAIIFCMYYAVFSNHFLTCRSLLGIHQARLVAALSKSECLKHCNHHLLTWTSTTSLCLRMQWMAIPSGASMSPLRVSPSEPLSILFRMLM